MYRMPCAPKRVMIVDDSATNRIIFSTFLKERDGLEIVTAANGEEAIAKHRTFPPDIIMMDLNMPGMDGFAATAAIRAQEADNRAKRSIIVAVTAHAIRGDRNRCLEAGMNDFLSKPVTKKQVLDFLETLLNCDVQPEPKPYTGPDRRSPDRSAGSAKDRCPVDLRRNVSSSDARGSGLILP
jgi:CheY-like chemotaxis protein